MRSVRFTRPTAVTAAVAVLGLVLAACGPSDPSTIDRPDQAAPQQATDAADTDTGEAPAMDAQDAEAPRVPPVFGYYDDEAVFFIHTEVSDPKIAEVLSDMMGSPVPVVASLATVPEAATSPVYVFTNGIRPQDTPAGPMGFQPDIFAAAPGDEDYTPLRQLVRVTWTDADQARLLTSVTALREAESDGQLTLEPTEVVVNAPLLTWPGGQR